jgi:DNA repair exonuclease SbcCD ATPase subunit
MKLRYFNLLAGGLMCGSLFTALPASAQSIEDRLRSQLRETTEQLHQLQDSQSQLQADKTVAEQQRDKALADLKQAQADLAAAKGKSPAEAETERSLAAEKASHAQDSQQLAKYKSAYEDLLGVSRSRDTERTQLQTTLKGQQTQLQTCEAKNVQLYQVGHEILDAYEHVGLGTVLSSREPFAQSARVKYDMIAQNYGDTLYAGKYDPRAVAPAGASATQAAASSSASAAAGVSAPAASK